jgi:hypothetical protein
MTTEQMRFLLACLLIPSGMIGLYAHIEYSGWVLFFGLMTIP